MRQQYKKIKAKHKDALLFFRLGDFYEMFDEDAKLASRLLGLTLTSRSHGRGGKIPLAGIPYHAADKYMAKLLAQGYKVAICEQVEDPKKAKGVVKREVIEVVTPGTTTMAGTLKEKSSNYLLGLVEGKPGWGMAILDLSTGDFQLDEIGSQELKDEISLINPSEILLPEGHRPDELKEIKESFSQTSVTLLEDWKFSYDDSYRLLLEHFGVASLDGFGCEAMELGIRAAGAILAYVKEMQSSPLSHITRVTSRNRRDYMTLDPFTLQNLELIEPLRGGDQRGTLLHVLDKTLTPMGGRLLREWIKRPLLRVEQIRERLDGVEELVEDPLFRERLRGLLKSVQDLERLAGRVGCGKATPRDLVGLKLSFQLLPQVRIKLGEAKSVILNDLSFQLEDLSPIGDLIGRAIVDEPPLLLTEGGIIRQGYDPSLDELRAISRDGKSWIAKLQETERARTKIPSLKVGYNRVFGYYIEVTRPHLSKVPSDYMRRQTMTNAERFITPQLKEYEAKVLGAEERIGEMEYELFMKIRAKVAEECPRILKIARVLSCLDCILTLAQVASENAYCKPQVNDGEEISIKEGRHPVVERLLEEGFVPNDCLLNMEDHEILIITGPNMAGKSTYLRQVGLIVLMAQLGSFVPAQEAKIGVVDRIFTRVGASDILAKGQSTFLVEMNETANILNNASPQSLILLDEIGRGTSTYDGLSIAWAVTEEIHNNPKLGAKTLFATHYHELTSLAGLLPRVKNYQVAVREWGDKVVFLRKIIEGGCDDSYGIQVAKLAGVPQEVIDRAKEILANLENGGMGIPDFAQGKRAPKFQPTPQLSLFSALPDPLLEELKSLDLNSMTPLEALNKLAELVKRAKNQ